MLTRANKIPRVITATCDGCSSEFLETEAFDYREASAEMGEAGWVTAQVEGKFTHYCPDCAGRLGIS